MAPASHFSGQMWQTTPFVEMQLFEIDNFRCQGGKDEPSFVKTGPRTSFGQAFTHSLQKVHSPFENETSGKPLLPILMMFSGQASAHAIPRVQCRVNSVSFTDHGGRKAVLSVLNRPLKKPVLEMDVTMTIYLLTNHACRMSLSFCPSLTVIK